MVFSRIFGSKPKPDVGAAAEPEAEEADESVPEGPGEEGEDFHWTSRATALIPGGASTGSKRGPNLYGGEQHLPTHFVRAAGCHLYTANDETLVDCTMALGSVALGYAEPDLTRAVIETLASGSVSGLSPTHEVELAEKFCGVVPCAERVQFLKTGAEAMSAAVRIARTYTGRDVVVGCGYFGWHDWCSDAAGVPRATRAAYRKVPFDDIPALERAVTEAGSELAAIALEPVIERMPSKEWIARARELADRAGAALIFDELKTGFRLATGGYQQVSGVTPDLAAFGKALANGHALAVVCGKEELMSAASKTWISSTLASEAGALAAARVVLAWHEKVDVCAELARTGAQMRTVVGNALVASGIQGVTIDGLDQMWLLRFKDPQLEDAFIATAVRNGVLFKKGAYNYASLAHDEEAIAEIESGASEAFVEIRDGGRR